MSLTNINLDQDTLAKLDACASFRSISREEMLKKLLIKYLLMTVIIGNAWKEGSKI